MLCLDLLEFGYVSSRRTLENERKSQVESKSFIRLNRSQTTRFALYSPVFTLFSTEKATYAGRVFFFSSLKFPCGRREEKRTGKSQQWIHLWLNFFSFDLQVYFATFAFPGKRTWLRFGEIWETFFFFTFF